MRFTLSGMIGVALLACATGPDQLDGTPPVFSFEYPSSVVPGTYQVVVPSPEAGTAVGVRLTNTGTVPATIEYGVCSVAVWLYRDGARSIRPAWENRPRAGEACIAIAYQQTIAPGGSFEVGGAKLGAGILGDSLADGRYLVRVAVPHRAPGTSSNGELVVLDAGTIDLAR
jgi:hypothetical protein